MTKKDYLKYVRANIVPECLATAVYMLAITYIIQAEAAMGSQLLPVAELSVILAGLVGVKLAFKKRCMSMATAARVALLVEMAGLGILVIFMYSGMSLLLTGVAFYLIRISNSIASPAMGEVCSKYERLHLTTPGSRMVATKLRERDNYYINYWRIAGVSCGVILFTIFGVDPLPVTMLGFGFLSLVVCSYQYYLITKYLD